MLIVTPNNLPAVELVGYGVCHPGWELMERTLPEFEFLMLVEGEMRFLIEGRELRLKKRSYVILMPGQSHAIAGASAGASYYYVHFSLPGWHSVSQGSGYAGELCIALHGQLEGYYGRLEQLLEEMVCVWQEPGRHNCVLLQALLLHLLALLADNTGKPEDTNGSAYPSMVHDAIYYIENQMPQAQSVQKLAEVFGVTPQYFIQTFRTCVGRTPLQYINHWKIERAKTMIRMGTMSFQEITYALGWDTPHYFSKMFKRATGMTPMDYKKRLYHAKKETE